MFSSPGIQIYSSENSQNLIQRKPGTQLKSRKPFIDRSVNGESPFERKLKSKLAFNKEVNVEQKISPKPVKEHILEDSDLNGEDFTFSGKEVKDTYNDIWPIPTLGKEGILKILRDYAGSYTTPPPSPCSSFDESKPEFPEICPDFLELPEFICNLEEPTFMDESFEVDLPECQSFEDLDCSLKNYCL